MQQQNVRAKETQENISITYFSLIQKHDMYLVFQTK